MVRGRDIDMAKSPSVHTRPTSDISNLFAKYFAVCFNVGDVGNSSTYVQSVKTDCLQLHSIFLQNKIGIYE
jgi:hypothetical protein